MLGRRVGGAQCGEERSKGKVWALVLNASEDLFIKGWIMLHLK